MTGKCEQIQPSRIKIQDTKQKTSITACIAEPQQVVTFRHCCSVQVKKNIQMVILRQLQ